MSGATPGAGRRRPNVVVIMTDQQKATAIDLYGGPVRTNGLARLAAAGMQFGRAYTPHPLCVPARVALWTGRWPHSTGARTNETPMPDGERHFAGVLREHGYRLGHFGKNHCFRRQDLTTCFDRVFLAGHGDRFGPDVTQVSSGPRRGEPQPDAGLRRPVAQVHDRSPEATATARVVAEAGAFLEAHAGDDRPVCLWVSIPDPHTPLQVPRQFAARYPPADLPLPPWKDGELAGKPERQRVFSFLLHYDQLTEADVRLAASVYYGMIDLIDERVGVLLDTLERLGLWQDTIVVFTSDHGDYLGEHHLLGKSNAFYDCLTRVPLLLSWPGHLPAGMRRSEPVSLIDVLPTVLTLAGVPLPEGVQGQLLPGTPGAPPARAAVVAEYGAGGPPVTLEVATRHCPPGAPRLLPPLLREREGEGHAKMIVCGRWKYVHDRDAGALELYDLETDPWELANLAGDERYRDVAAECRRQLLDWCLATEDARPVPLYYHPL